MREASSIGAGGYVVKSDAARELLRGVKAVLEGKRFVSASLINCGLDAPSNRQTVVHPNSDFVTFTQPENSGITRHHELGFYPEDRHFVDHVTRFIAAALKAGNAAIVVATESHTESLLVQLQAECLDMSTIIAEGRYIPLDAAETLATFKINGLPDRVRFLKVAGDLVMGAAKAVNGDSARVTACG